MQRSFKAAAARQWRVMGEDSTLAGVLTVSAVVLR
jgi:hypothetical protein